MQMKYNIITKVPIIILLQDCKHLDCCIDPYKVFVGVGGACFILHA